MSGFARFSSKRWVIHPIWCNLPESSWLSGHGSRTSFRIGLVSHEICPKMCRIFVIVWKYKFQHILGHISWLTRPIRKIVRPLCSLSQELPRGFHHLGWIAHLLLENRAKPLITYYKVHHRSHEYPISCHSTDTQACPTGSSLTPIDSQTVLSSQTDARSIGARP